MFRYLPTPAGVDTGLVVAVAAPVVTLVLPVVTGIFGVVATVGQGKNRKMIISMKYTKHDIN